MLPFIIPMAIRNIPWRLIAIGAAVVACIAAGIWFRGVLADRAELSLQNEAQAAQVKDLTDEVDRMNLQDALDHALFENVEAQKKIHAAEIKKQIADIRKLRARLNEATQSCFTLTLPTDYLDGLP